MVQKKKGGRYSKNEKEKRQNEVFKLHFERGYSAVKISEMMKVNRNTINSDINYWYSRLSNEWKSYDVESWCMKQSHRLESQRSRLFNELDKVQDISIKLSIEKMILDIDTKMMNFVTKTNYNKSTITHGAIEMLNNYAKDNGLKLRAINTNQIMSAPQEVKDQIFKILEDESKKYIGKM